MQFAGEGLKLPLILRIDLDCTEISTTTSPISSRSTSIMAKSKSGQKTTSGDSNRACKKSRSSAKSTGCTKAKSSRKSSKEPHTKQKKSRPNKITPTKISKKKPVKVKIEGKQKNKTSLVKREKGDKQSATERRKVDSEKPHRASSASRERSGGHGRKTPPSPASKSSKRSAMNEYETPPPSKKSHKLMPSASQSSARGTPSSNSSKQSSLSARKKLFERPSSANVNWMCSEDLSRIIIASDSKADADEVRAWSFKKKIAAVGKLYAPSALILPFAALATKYNIDISGMDTTVEFRTRNKAITTITDLVLEIIGETGNDTK